MIRIKKNNHDQILNDLLLVVSLLIRFQGTKLVLGRCKDTQMPLGNLGSVEHEYFGY